MAEKTLAELIKQLEKTNEDQQAYIRRFPFKPEESNTKEYSENVN